ncbi:MAG: hypothetical protein J7521_19880 [Caulobacter sp.]|nr:hypothetical protein [Caulobacter sp.]
MPDYEVVVEGDGRRVVMSGGLDKDYRKIATKDKASLRRWMENWCGDVEGAMPDTRMKAQERFSDVKGRTVLIIAFKSYQARLYGFIRRVAERDTFFVTAIDPDKKDDDADPKVLKRAKLEAFRILEVMNLR